MLKQIRNQLIEHSPRDLAVPLPEAAVLIALTDNTLNPEIILTRRSTRLNTHSGEVAFPGGKRDPEVRDLQMTALRETHEEIGVPGDSVDVLGRTGQVISRFGIKVTPFVGLVPESIKLHANLDELDRVFRVPLAFFLEAERLRTDELRYKQQSFFVPAWQYGDYQIWGLTAIMLVEFLNVGLNAGIPLDVPQQRGQRVEGGIWRKQA